MKDDPIVKYGMLAFEMKKGFRNLNWALYYERNYWYKAKLILRRPKPHHPSE